MIDWMLFHTQYIYAVFHLKLKNDMITISFNSFKVNRIKTKVFVFCDWYRNYLFVATLISSY